MSCSDKTATDVLNAEEHALMREAIDSLGRKLRDVVVRRFIQDMPREQVADELNISVNAVEQRLTRALKKLREHRCVRRLRAAELL